jgi:hypothetical protein
MIKVFVWLPAGYEASLDAVFDKIFNGKSSTNRKDSTTSTFFTDPFEDTKQFLEDNDSSILKRISGISNPIPIVQDAMQLEMERYFGHVSLLVQQKNGLQQYLSFWPIEEDKRILFRARGKFLNNYQEDLSGMKRKEDVVIEISNLSEELVYEFISERKKLHKTKRYTYNLFVQNCSTFVTSALYQGVPKSILAEVQDFFSRYLRASEAAAVYSASLIGLYNLAFRKEIQKEYVENLIRNASIGGNFLQKHFSSTKSVFSIFEIGLQTPKSVLEYARRIKELK